VTSTSTAERRRPFTLLDVFTDVRLTGNALAVVHDADSLDDRTMLAFAFETRLAETTFVQMATDAGADYRNRIFSMAGELPFAGHPSLGTAVAVARQGGVQGDARYVQQTGAGLQQIEVTLDGDRASASMLQQPPEFGAEHEAATLLAAVGLLPSDGHPDLPPQVVATGLPHLILPLSNPGALARIVRDSAAVDAALEAAGAYGLYIAWCAPDGGTARVRMFARSTQIAEDPATGSAAGPLCAYLHRRTGAERVTITQGVEMGRPSRLEAQIVEDRVRVGGEAVVVADGFAIL
jgi:trans-2,3-dihydro-3-hydroxyanthranilate isomerase